MSDEPKITRDHTRSHEIAQDHTEDERRAGERRDEPGGHRRGELRRAELADGELLRAVGAEVDDEREQDEVQPLEGAKRAQGRAEARPAARLSSHVT